MLLLVATLTFAVSTVNSYTIDSNCNVPFDGKKYDMRPYIQFCLGDGMMNEVKSILSSANTGLKPSVIDKAKQFVNGNGIVSCAGRTSCGSFGGSCNGWPEPHIMIGDLTTRGFIESVRDHSTDSVWCRRDIVCDNIYHELMHYVASLNGCSIDHCGNSGCSNQCDPENMPFNEMDCALDWYFQVNHGMNSITCSATTADGCLRSRCSPNCRPWGGSIFAKTDNFIIEISQNTLYGIMALLVLLIINGIWCYFGWKQCRKKRKVDIYSRVKQIASSDEENVNAI